MTFPFRAARRAVVAAVLVSSALAGLGRGPAYGDTPPVRPSAPPAAGDGKPASTITLITGDRVSVSAGPNPQVTVTTVPRKDGSRPPALIEQARGDQYVIPQDAEPYLAAGVLDQTLFDVTYLAQNGYADAADRQLPLITQVNPHVSMPKVASTVQALPEARIGATLRSVHGAAATVPKTATPSFWAALTAHPANRPAAARAQSALNGDVAKVWLDRRVQVQADQNVSMIGAPQAWAAGYTGQGVKVAVLDTGIDATHPDLAGKVAGSANFTDDPDVVDHYGHGTHVASIIAGSGAASGGRYEGVAPDASLLIGKVLDNQGSGADSQVIAGMEWAAQAGAKVVNLSLGDPAAPADQAQDPAIQAVNELSATTHTLFVIAAGNSGGTSTVSSPGLATSALTVGAVDDNDQLASFSSRGPVVTDDTIAKPDIAAPGVDIVAARAAGTHLGDNVGDYYTQLSGTSMATPHVAGAAAILAQQHPDWTGDQLKDALMAASKDDGYSFAEQGAGRVDIAKAVTQQVTSTSGTADFGRIPMNNTQHADRSIGYRNDTDHPVTLTITDSLSATTSGTDASAALTVPGQLTVPAHGNAQLPVSLDPTALGTTTDIYSGAVEAAADGITLRTAVAVRHSEGVYPVRFTITTAFPTYPAQYFMQAVNVDHPDAELPNGNGNLFLTLPLDPTTFQSVTTVQFTLPLPAGRWSFASQHAGWRPDTRVDLYQVTQPEVDVHGPTEVAMDDATAVPVSVRTDKPSEQILGGLSYRRVLTDGEVSGLTSAIGTPNGGVFMTPIKPVSTGTVMAKLESQRGVPQVTMSVDSKTGKGMAVRPTYGDAYILPAKLGGTHHHVPVVYVGDSIDPSDAPALRGKLVLRDLPTGDPTRTLCETSEDEAKIAADAGALGILQIDTLLCFPFGTLAGISNLVPVLSVDADEGARLRTAAEHGPVSVTYTGTPQSPYLYRLALPMPDKTPASLQFHVSDRQLARIRTTYHSDSGSSPDNGSSIAIGTRLSGNPGDQVLASYAFPVRMPLTQDEYVGPVRSDVIWTRSASPEYPNLSTESRGTALRAGRMPDEQWLSAPRAFGPSGAPPTPGMANVGWCFACRRLDTLYVVPEYNASNPTSGSFYALPTGTTAKLYSGDTEIPPAGNGYGVPEFTLPHEAGNYRLVSDAAPTAPTDSLGFSYGIHQHTEWTFRSAPSDTSDLGDVYCLPQYLDHSPTPCSVQQLLYLRYQERTDATNKVARGLTSLSITPYYDASTQWQSPVMSSLTVQYSVDNGATWRSTLVIRGPHGYQATFLTPWKGPADQAVSIRVHAKDRSGNAVDQTIYRAFGLR